jgi:tRNA 2-thiouridine synthesizing protein A
MSSRWFGRSTGSRARAAGRMPAERKPPRGADRDGGPEGAGGPEGPGATDGAPVPTPVLTIDALGRKCPIPIIMLAERINDVPIGAVIAVLADDPAAENDVPAWCAMKSHDYVVTQTLTRGWAFLVRRGY